MQDEEISKTRRKEDMHALQKIGAELIELSEDQLSGMQLPERLKDAVLEAKRLRPREALRRQMQFIGRLMRDINAAPIRAQLDRWRSQSDAHTGQLHAIERWRDELIEGDPALERFLREHPGADSQKLRALMRNARRERDAGQPPKSYRELFRVLRDIVAAGTGDE
jgi:ribosome-associated protein